MTLQHVIIMIELFVKVYCVKMSLLYFAWCIIYEKYEVKMMSNEDLLASLQELLEASSAMTSGQLPTASQLERYQRAREWAQRLLDREEKAKNSRL